MKSFFHLSERLAADASQKWEDIQTAAHDSGVAYSESVFNGSLRFVLAFSDFIAQGCIRNPLMLYDLVQSKDLFHSYDENIYYHKIRLAIPDQVDESLLGQLLRQFRQREMTRIAWRDLAGWAHLSETMNDLSSLADACLEYAHTVLYRKLCQEFGTPVDSLGRTQKLVVLGMGKLGAKELNFSSDIDLIFAYPNPGQTVDGPKEITNETFFSLLCRKLITLLSRPTPEGFVFRVDANLRPFGENGPIVMSFGGMEEYYLRQGREWERYAWIKARTVAGDFLAGEELLTRLKPFVFRRYLDFGVFDALREMKAKISREVVRKSMNKNIKLGAGGIREVEFFGQIFQLTRGGIDPELQVPSIMKILQILARKQTISQEAYEQLTLAYVFFRLTEHRLQEFSDHQTHQIPVDALEVERLAMSMGFSDAVSFVQMLERHMEQVHSQFVALLEAPQSGTSECQDESAESLLTAVWLEQTDREQGQNILVGLGFQDPESVCVLLDNFRNEPATRALSGEGRHRLDRLMPYLLKEIIPLEYQVEGLKRIIDILICIERRTSYLALLLENPYARHHLVTLAHASPLIATFLSRHPSMLDELLDARILYKPPRKLELKAEITEKMRRVPSSDMEHQIEQLCIFKQANILRVAAADVMGILPLMRTSDHLTELAETVLDQVLDICWNELVARHGKPFCSLDYIPVDRGFAVIGYGKLGGIELGYNSDLDLVFLHAGSSTCTDSQDSPIDNGQFFTRLGQRIIHMLTTLTTAGRLYEVDMRLRPSGNSGILVCHIDAFEKYQIENAWVWEHQALLRARPVCGDIQVIRRFQDIREKVLAAPRNIESLRREVANMREKMRAEHVDWGSHVFNIKQDIGGIVDIEFLVQYLTLLNAHQYESLLQWTDNVRLLQTLSETGVLTDNQAHDLKEAYLIYRAAVHRLNLQEKPSVVAESRFQSLRSTVTNIWRQFMMTP